MSFVSFSLENEKWMVWVDNRWYYKEQSTQTYFLFSKENQTKLVVTCSLGWTMSVICLLSWTCVHCTVCVCKYSISQTIRKTACVWFTQWHAGRGVGGPRPPQLEILGGHKNEKGVPIPCRILKVGGKKTHSKKYSYLRQEKICL
jgi:hypothetical protein